MAQTKQEFLIYAEMANQAYDTERKEKVGDFTPMRNMERTDADNGEGFSAAAYFDDKTGTLVIAFGGTEGYVQDWQANINHHGTGLTSAQQRLVDQYVRQAREEARRRGYSVQRTVYTGHSLGGFLSQYALSKDTNRRSRAITFNSPGSYGPRDNRATYVYTDPKYWGQAGGIAHNRGYWVSENVYFVLDDNADRYRDLTGGHGIDPLIKALEKNGSGRVVNKREMVNIIRREYNRANVQALASGNYYAIARIDARYAGVPRVRDRALYLSNVFGSNGAFGKHWHRTQTWTRAAEGYRSALSQRREAARDAYIFEKLNEHIDVRKDAQWRALIMAWEVSQGAHIRHAGKV